MAWIRARLCSAGSGFFKFGKCLAFIGMSASLQGEISHSEWPRRLPLREISHFERYADYLYETQEQQAGYKKRTQRLQQDNFKITRR